MREMVKRPLGREFPRGKKNNVLFWEKSVGKMGGGSADFLSGSPPGAEDARRCKMGISYGRDNFTMMPPLSWKSLTAEPQLRQENYTAVRSSLNSSLAATVNWKVVSAEDRSAAMNKKGRGTPLSHSFGIDGSRAICGRPLEPATRVVEGHLCRRGVFVRYHRPNVPRSRVAFFVGAVVCVILGHVRPFAWSRAGRRFRSVASRFSWRRPVVDDGGGRRL